MMYRLFSTTIGLISLCCETLICASVVPSFGIARQPRQQHVEVLDKPAWDLLGWDAEEVFHRGLGNPQPGGSDQHEAAQSMLLMDCEPGGEATAESCEGEGFDPKKPLSQQI